MLKSHNTKDVISEIGRAILTEELLLALECGATLCDVRGYLFDACTDELSLNDRAIEKQEKLIDEIHAMGGEVLMSSHVFHFLPKEQVYTIRNTYTLFV